MRILPVLFLAIVAFSGCAVSARNYNLFYLNLVRAKKEKFPPTHGLNSYDFNENNKQYFEEHGYVMIGYDAIRYTYINYQQAVNAGCWIGANVMLYKYQYAGTASGNAVVPFYTPGESYTVNSTTSGSVTASGSAYGSVVGTNGSAYGSAYSNGYGTYRSTATTTVTAPGTLSFQTVPYSHDYYDQYAVFFVKKYFWCDQDIPVLQKPDAKSRVITTIANRGWFEILSKGRTYCKISYLGQTGYILSTYSLH